METVANQGLLGALIFVGSFGSKVEHRLQSHRTRKADQNSCLSKSTLYPLMFNNRPVWGLYGSMCNLREMQAAQLLLTLFAKC